MSRLRLLRGEDGFSLIFTLLTLLVTTVTMTAAIQYTTSNSTSANRSERDQIAYALAEAGLANGAAVLSKPTNNSLDQSLLLTSEPDENNPAHANYILDYAGGTVKYWGVLTGHQWLMHGVGIVTDPTGRTAPVRRHATSTIRIMPTLTQTLNSNAWNYMFAKNTGAACDVLLDNSVTVDASMYILGDLCFDNTASMVKAAAPDLTGLYVGEHIQFLGTGSVGSAASKIAQAQVGLGCRIGSSGAWTSPCTAATRVHADTVLSGSSPGTGPVADFAYWYTNAKPGPTQFCGTGYSGIATTAFESSGSTTRNNSAGTFNLTPGSSYTCQYWDNLLSPPALLGELSWNNTTKKLTVKGVVYIDGSVLVSNNAVNEYDGLATLYVSGTFTINGTSQLCGAIAGGNCNFASWNPNVDNLGIIADGAGNSVALANSARYQGSIYATNTVDLGSSAQYDGPMVAGTFRLANSVQTHEFPTITSVPVGWPGNPTVYAEPQPPQNYSG
jgi:hypothetical protein